jgi:hypothetical protein
MQRRKAYQAAFLEKKRKAAAASALAAREAHEKLVKADRERAEAMLQASRETVGAEATGVSVGSLGALSSRTLGGGALDEHETALRAAAGRFDAETLEAQQGASNDAADPAGAAGGAPAPSSPETKESE